MDANRTFAELTHLLEREGRLLQELADTMQRHRTAYVALRPSELEHALEKLAALRSEADRLEQERVECTARLTTALGMPATTTLRLLVAAAPTALRARLHSAGEQTRRAARTVQVESRVGSRLLELSRSVQEGMYRELAGTCAARGAKRYDRHARAAGAAQSNGSLISGTI